MMINFLSTTKWILRSPGSQSTIALATFLFICSSSPAQISPVQQNPREASSTSDSRRSPQPSDLANENYEHLAAAPRQIQEVLLKDAGLLVALKRLAIKEATDNGQIVEDSLLTDQAIFDRLDQDIKFRSLATRLVQRYGYLLPSFNPDSELAKQRDLLLKERARRQLQVEAQEDAEIDAEIKKRANLEETTSDCDRNPQDCLEPGTRRTLRRGNSLSNGRQEQGPDQG